VSRLGAPGVGISTLGNYGLVAGQAVRTLVLARILGPASFGVLNVANVAAGFTPQADIGTGRIGEQNASEARGRGEIEASDHELVEAAGARMAPGLLLCAVLGVVAAGLAATGADPTISLAVAFVAVSAPLQAAWWAVVGWLRVHGHFRDVSYAQIGQVVLWLTAVPAAALAFGVNGALFAMALSFVPPVLIGARRAPLLHLLRPRWSAFRRLVRRGFPVWLIFATTFAFFNVDQAVVGSLLGADALGIYAIGLLTSTALLALSDGAAAAAHPKTLEDFAREGRLVPGTPSVVRVMHVVQSAFGVLVPLSWLGVALVTQVFLTEYGAALPIVALLGAAASAYGATTASNAALLAVGLHRLVPAVLVLATVLRVGLSFGLVGLGAGLAGIGVAALISTVAFTLVYLLLVARAFELGARRTVAFVSDHLLGPVLLGMLALVAAVAYAERGTGGFVVASAAAVVLSALAQGAAYLARRSRPSPRHRATSTARAPRRRGRHRAPVGVRKTRGRTPQ